MYYLNNAYVNNLIFKEEKLTNWSLFVLTELIYFGHLRDLEYFYFNFLTREHTLKKNQEL